MAITRDEYPTGRKGMFALEFLHALFKSGVQEVGTSGIALLTTVVLAEDSNRFQRPAQFFDGSLAERLGQRRQQFHSIIHVCVDGGWLHVVRASAKPSLFWVAIPEQILIQKKFCFDWQAVVAALHLVGIGKTLDVLLRLQENLVPPSLALDVIQFAIDTQFWGVGKVRTRLMSLRPGQDPTDERLWMSRDV